MGFKKLGKNNLPTKKKNYKLLRKITVKLHPSRKIMTSYYGTGAYILGSRSLAIYSPMDIVRFFKQRYYMLTSSLTEKLS